MPFNAAPIEIQMLLWSIVLGLIQLVAATVMATKDQGLPYNLSPRDEPPPPVGKITGRLMRALKNFLETFPFFAAAVLAVTVANKASDTSALGVQLYFWARLLYVPVYAAGIPVARTLLWTVSIIGLVLVVIAAV